MISEIKEDLKKKNVPSLLTFKGLSNKQTFFYFIVTELKFGLVALSFFYVLVAELVITRPTFG